VKPGGGRRFTVFKSAGGNGKGEGQTGNPGNSPDGGKKFCGSRTRAMHERSGLGKGQVDKKKKRGDQKEAESPVTERKGCKKNKGEPAQKGKKKIEQRRLYEPREDCL